MKDVLSRGVNSAWRLEIKKAGPFLTLPLTLVIVGWLVLISPSIPDKPYKARNGKKH